MNNIFLDESGKLCALLLCACCFVLCCWLMSLANSTPSWIIATSTKTWRSMSSGSHHMGMHLKTSVSCLTSPREALPGGNRTIASMDLSYPHTMQCNAALTYTMAIWHMTYIHYWQRHQRCILVKSRIGLHLHTRFTSPGLHSMWTSTMLGWLSSSFARQPLSVMKTFRRSGSKMSMHTLLPHRWSSSMKQARMTEQSTGIMDVQSLGLVWKSVPILCEGSDIALSLPYHWMGIKLWT